MARFSDAALSGRRNRCNPDCCITLAHVALNWCVCLYGYGHDSVSRVKMEGNQAMRFGQHDFWIPNSPNSQPTIALPAASVWLDVVATTELPEQAFWNNQSSSFALFLCGSEHEQQTSRALIFCLSVLFAPYSQHQPDFSPHIFPRLPRRCLPCTKKVGLGAGASHAYSSSFWGPNHQALGMWGQNALEPFCI